MVCLTLSSDYVVRQYKYAPGLHNNAPILYFVVYYIHDDPSLNYAFGGRPEERRKMSDVMYVIFGGDHDRGIIPECRVTDSGRY